jgi:hypothetical protein
MTMAREATRPPCAISHIRSPTRSQLRSLLSMPRLKSARSRALRANCSRMRIAQISFEFERRLLSDQLSLVPRNALLSILAVFVHDGLLVWRGGAIMCSPETGANDPKRSVIARSKKPNEDSPPRALQGTRRACTHLGRTRLRLPAHRRVSTSSLVNTHPPNRRRWSGAARPDKRADCRRRG